MQEQLPTILKEILRLSVWLAILLAIFVPLERVVALHPRQVFGRKFPSDLAYYFLSSLLPKMVLVLPMAAVAWVLHLFVPADVQTYTAAMPVWLRLVTSLVVAELGFYWGHRWSHAIPWLWRFHAVHHSAEEMYWLVNTRAHPVDLIFTRFCGLVPMYVLGLAHPLNKTLDLIPLVVLLMGTIWGFFVHANVAWRFGPLTWLLSTPGFHHWHHTYSSPLNKNFAAMLPIFDRLFGTFHLPKALWPEKYGTPEPVGPTLMAQLVRPLTHDTERQPGSPVAPYTQS